MTVMLIILAAAAVGLGLARWLRIPSVPLLVLAGIGVSAAGLADDPQLFQDGLLLGLTFLVFAAGVEMNPARVGVQRGAAIRVGIAQFFLVALIGLGVALAVGFEPLQALYVAFALTASSTLVVMRLLQQRRQLFEPFGRLVVGVLLLQDLLMILLIAALAHAAEGPWVMLGTVTGTLGLMLAAYAGLKWVTPWLLVQQKLDEENQLLVALAILFLFVGVSHQMGIPLVAGAFLGGVSLSAFPVSGILRGQLASLSDFFLAVFFVTLGTMLSLPGWQGLALAGGLAALVLAVTPPLVSWIARQAGLTARAATESGLLLAQTSEFSLVVGLVGVQQGHIGQGLLSVIAIVTVVTMMLTPLLATDRVTWSLMHLTSRRQRAGAGSPPSDHILLLGCGQNGLRLLKRLLAHKLPVVVVDDDAAVAKQVRGLGIEAIRGDGADLRVLESAGARQARLIISTLRRVEDNESLLDYAQGVTVLLRVFDPDEAERLRSKGGTPLLESYAAADDLLAWCQRRGIVMRDAGSGVA